MSRSTPFLMASAEDSVLTVTVASRCKSAGAVSRDAGRPALRPAAPAAVREDFKNLRRDELDIWTPRKKRYVLPCLAAPLALAGFVTSWRITENQPFRAAA